MHAANFSGNRHFIWFKPERRKPSEYESYTIGQQSGPQQWLDVDWPLCFDDGQAPFTEAASEIKCSAWDEFRDPLKVWQRPYVSRNNNEEQALDVMIKQVLQDGVADRVNPVWRDEILGKYYAAWPFVEYGQFLALSYAVRQVLDATLTFSLAFQVSDKIRHQQDIVHLIFELKEALPAYSDAEARPAWMDSPALVPTREIIECLINCDDWAEIVIVLGLAFEPLVGNLFKTEFMSRNASSNGDAVTPMILANARRDSKYHLQIVQVLVDMVQSDAAHGAANKTIIRNWLLKWTPLCEQAAQAMQTLFEIEGIVVGPFDQALNRVKQAQTSLAERLGL
jgi:hypothetical protein